MDSFEIEKTSKKGNTRKVDLRPQLLGLEYMDQTAVDAALEGKHIPIPSTPQPGTALLRFRGEYTGAGGLSVEGMAKILGAAAGKEVQVLHSHRVGIELSEPVPPKVDKLWLDNIVRAEAFMGLERIWHPEKGVNNRGHMGAPDPTAIASITTKTTDPRRRRTFPRGGTRGGRRNETRRR